MTPQIEFPKLAEGFRLQAVSVFCDSWEAWDLLTEDDGWVERFVRGSDGTVHGWKTLGPWPNGYIAAHPPQEPRT